MSKQYKINSKYHKTGPNPESGQAVLIAVILSLVVSTLILFGISLPVADQIKNSNDYLSSQQALINTETLNEEVLYRLNNKKSVPSVLSMSILENINSANVSDINSGEKEVVSTGQVGYFTRKLQSDISSNKNIALNYGTWISNGGLRMENSSEIQGDVFSLGGSLLLNSSAISGNLSTSSYPVNLPISDDDISNWKNQASSGQIINGDLTISNSTTTVGAVKIVGDLFVKNSAILTLGGPVYVTGSIYVSNSARVQLSPSYSSKSETIVSDGIIDIKSSAYLGGSGSTGSNLIIATESSSGCTNLNCTGGTPAINVSNSVMANAVLIAPHGAVYLSNSSNTKGVVANYLYMSNSSSLQYDSSLSNINFNSSTSTIWRFNSIKEI